MNSCHGERRPNVLGDCGDCEEYVRLHAIPMTQLTRALCREAACSRLPLDQRCRRNHGHGSRERCAGPSHMCGFVVDCLPFMSFTLSLALLRLQPPPCRRCKHWPCARQWMVGAMILGHAAAAAAVLTDACPDATQRLQFGNSRHVKSPETLSALALMEVSCSRRVRVWWCVSHAPSFHSDTPLLLSLPSARSLMLSWEVVSSFVSSQNSVCTRAWCDAGTPN